MQTKPFRWNIGRREQLGQLISTVPDPDDTTAFPFLEELRTTSARILAQGDDSNLAFIGRTPENFFDYLSGIFEGLNNAPDLHVIQFSLRWAGEKGLRSIPESQRNGFFDYLQAENLDPATIASATRPLALVDFVVDGGTMENIVKLLQQHAERDGVDWHSVQRRLRIIGLRVRTKNSPNTWRWQQNQDWLDLIPAAKISNVSATFDFLCHLGNDQPKLTKAHRPELWDRFNLNKKPPTDDQLKALNLAVYLFDLGRTSMERRRLASLIAKTHQIRQPATRALVGMLNSAGQG